MKLLQLVLRALGLAARAADEDGADGLRRERIRDRARAARAAADDAAAEAAELRRRAEEDARAR